MKFFIDTADRNEVKEANNIGLLDGVTTNPSLVAKTGRDYRSVIAEICEICPGPVSAEVLPTDFAGIMKEAREWAKVAPNVVVKIPLIQDGLKATRACFEEGIQTNVTLCFNAVQALLAAKAGATFISPFVGRLDDIALHGMDLIGEIRKIYDQYDFKTEILVASIRSPLHIKEAALFGAHVSTVPYKVLTQLIKHPLSDIGLATFLADAQRIPKH